MSLQKLINPKSIAVIGVTDKHGSFGKNIAISSLKSKETDTVYFVHPSREILFEKKCYKLISHLPEVVDCAVICTPKEIVPGVLQEAGELGVKAAIVFASGFSEEGSEEGKELENRLTAIARKYDMKVLGPNCMGALNNINKINMWAGHTYWNLSEVNKGIAIITQSGFVAAEILNTDFFNVSYGISTGNGNITTLEEFMEFVVEDDNVSVVSMYLEGIKEPERFIHSLKRAAEKRKPVVILKSGRSIKGAAAAASHTGNLAGSNKAYLSVFEKYGVIMAENLEEFMCISQTLSVLNGKYTEKTTFAAINFSGGENTLCADLAEENDIELADILDETKAEMKKYLPRFAVAKNPLDATTALFREEAKIIGILKAFQNDPNVGCIMAGTNIKRTEDDTTTSICKSIAKAKSQGVTKPIFAVPSLECYRSRETRKILENAGIPVMSSVNTAFSCLNKLSKYFNYDYKKRTLLTATFKNDNVPKETFALSELDSKNEMMKYGVSVPAQALALNIDEMKTAVNGMKFPLALKINSSEILHKSDVGGVMLDIQNVDDAVFAYHKILENIKKNVPRAKEEGILIQEMMPEGIEIIIGVTNDMQFGPMLLVGLGGIFVEVFKDAVLYPIPMNKYEAHEMLKKLKAYKLLKGYRGSEECDIEALTDMMVAVSNYAYAQRDEIKEMDLNPVFVYPKGEGVCAVDALIVKYVNKDNKL